MRASWPPAHGFLLPLRGSDDTRCLPASRWKRPATGCTSTIRAIRFCPKIGMSAAPLGLFAAILPLLRRQIIDGRDFDLIDALFLP